MLCWALCRLFIFPALDVRVLLPFVCSQVQAMQESLRLLPKQNFGEKPNYMLAVLQLQQAAARYYFTTPQVHLVHGSPADSPAVKLLSHAPVLFSCCGIPHTLVTFSRSCIHICMRCILYFVCVRVTVRTVSLCTVPCTPETKWWIIRIHPFTNR